MTLLVQNQSRGREVGRSCHWRYVGWHRHGSQLQVAVDIVSAQNRLAFLV